MSMRWSSACLDLYSLRVCLMLDKQKCFWNTLEIASELTSKSLSHLKAIRLSDTATHFLYNLLRCTFHSTMNNLQARNALNFQFIFSKPRS